MEQIDHNAMRDAHLVLVVDDEPSIRNSLVPLLEVLGCRANAVPGVEEAFRAIRQNPYAAILSDVDMPGLSGVAFYEKLCQVDPALSDRFIFITGSPHLIPEGLPCPVLQKPFKIGDLSRVLEMVLDVQEGADKQEHV
jgi:DNA-binding NtrC family response regulator